LEFDPAFSRSLPETHALVRDANFIVHPSVLRVVLHGSRGLAGGFRTDSDIDLSLIVDLAGEISQTNLEDMLQSVYQTTQSAWQSAIEADLAIIFETSACALKCFEQTTWEERICPIGGLDCFGLYKVQKGFQGLVTNAGIEVRRMYPCLEIWRRA